MINHDSFSTFTLNRQPFYSLYPLLQLHGMEYTQFLVMFFCFFKLTIHEKDYQHNTDNNFSSLIGYVASKYMLHVCICTTKCYKNVLSHQCACIWLIKCVFLEKEQFTFNLSEESHIIHKNSVFQYVFAYVDLTLTLHQMKRHTVHKNMVVHQCFCKCFLW